VRIRSTWESTNLRPLGYTNAYCGYVPTRAESPGGGYEFDDSYKYVGMWKIADYSEGIVRDAVRSLRGEILEP